MRLEACGRPFDEGDRVMMAAGRRRSTPTGGPRSCESVVKKMRVCLYFRVLLSLSDSSLRYQSQQGGADFIQPSRSAFLRCFLFLSRFFFFSSAAPSPLECSIADAATAALSFAFVAFARDDPFVPCPHSHF